MHALSGLCVWGEGVCGGEGVCVCGGGCGCVGGGLCGEGMYVCVYMHVSVSPLQLSIMGVGDRKPTKHYTNLDHV